MKKWDKLEKFYFLKSVLEKGQTRIKVLSNQVIPNDLGSTIASDSDPSLNVACSKSDRSKYPTGTIFVCQKLYLKNAYYKVADGSIHAYHTMDDKNTDRYDEISKQLQKIVNEGEETKEKPKKVKPASLLDKLMKSKDLKPPTAVKDGFHVPKDLWYYLLRNLALNKNTMLIGPTGTGKTEVIEHLCAKVEREVKFLDMGAMQDPISGLLGVHRLEGDESVFDQASFTDYVQKENVIVLDEISRAPSTANNILFPCLDSRRELPMEIASSKVDRVIDINEDCCFFATANLGAEYTGTQSLDRALIDRFSLVELDYMSKAVESSVLVKRTGCDKSEADMIAGLAYSIRNMFKKGELSTPISTRHTMEIASLVRDGFELVNAFEFVLFPMYEGTKSMGERSTLYSLLTSK